VSKKTVTLVEIKDIAPLAAKNYVGEKVALEVGGEPHYVFYDEPTYGSMKNLPSGAIPPR
jgi:hypothetical protein